MKLRRLDLTRYGHFSDVTLAFPPEAALCVVHGANEAGKSTALAAIADALFGFGHRTDFDFLHGASHLRIGITVVEQDGAEASFIRRKGRRDTLRDNADQPVPEEALTRFLGGASRELFERGFGLDGARLRQGGLELLRGGGDAGESLLAGMGLLDLRGAAARLEEEAKSLVGDGRGKRLLSEAVDAWRRAQRESDERAVAPKSWLDAVAARDATANELERIQASYRALTLENTRLQRVRRTAPVLTGLDAARADLGLVADAPAVPADAETRMLAATTARREAARDAEREAAEALRLGQALASLPADAGILTAQDAIDGLARRLPVVEQALADLPKVRAAVLDHRGKVAAALDDLGTTRSPEEARDAVPGAPVRRTMQRLINQHAALSATATAAETGLTAARRRRDQAAEALRGVAEPTSFALLRRGIDAVRNEGKLDQELTDAHLAAVASGRAAADALAALPLWTGGMERLARCPLPRREAEEAAARRLDQAEKTATEAHAQLVRRKTDLATVHETIMGFAAGETVPTPEAVAEARAARDQVWRQVRRTLDLGEPPGDVAEEFERASHIADRLADRRADDAQRVAGFLGATARREVLSAQAQADEAAASMADAAVAEAVAAWRALWAPAGLVPDRPAAMTQWRRDHAAVVKLAEAAEAGRQRLARAEARHADARSVLASVLPGYGEDQTLSALLVRAETACAAAEADHAAWRARSEALAREDLRLPDLEHAMAAADQALLAWRADWAKVVADQSLPADASVGLAETALAAWTRIAEAAPAWRADERRVQDMTATIADFAAEVEKARRRMNWAEGEPMVIATGLIRALAQARQTASDATALTARIAEHEAALAAAARRLSVAEADLAALRTMTGAADDTDLERRIARARERDRLVESVARQSANLLALGDGQREESLRNEAGSITSDTAAARLADIDAELHDIAARREQLSADRAGAENALAAMSEGRDAASKAQEAENALAEARGYAERYAQVHVAGVLLRAGIDRFRRNEQGPLLRSASAHFSLLTQGRYVRLDVDQADNGKMVLMAMRENGVECPVEALSEGTRDQLYLALRVSAIEAHARRAEPLPFIADDLLVHFDDARAALAMSLLVGLGRTSQVILFTHHDHVAAMAEGRDGVSVSRLPSAGS